MRRLKTTSPFQNFDVLETNLMNHFGSCSNDLLLGDHKLCDLLDDVPAVTISVLRLEWRSPNLVQNRA